MCSYRSYMGWNPGWNMGFLGEGSVRKERIDTAAAALGAGGGLVQHVKAAKRVGTCMMTRA